MKKLAQIISFVLGPQIWGPIIIWLIFNFNPLPYYQFIIYFPLICIINLIIPLGYICIAYLKKQIKDLDMTDRKERIVPLIIVTISLLISSIIFQLSDMMPLRNIFVFFTSIILINGTITLFWKISLHMAVNIIGWLLVMNYFGIKMLPLIVVIPLVYWSRLYLKKHDVWQLLGSLVLNGGIVLLFIFFGL